MRYSVIIPMYNNKDTIARAIKSVYSQTRVDLIDEIVVVDDGSVDDSYSIVEEISKASQLPIVILRKTNGGAASARNVGIKNAKNNYIALLDADDEWLPNKIEIQNEILVNNPEIKAIGSNRDGEIINVGLKYKKGVNKISTTQYCMKNWPCTPSLIFDRTVFNNQIYFPEDMSHAEEGIFFLSLAHKCGLYYCMESLVICGGGKRPFGVSGLSGNIKKMHLGVLKMLRKAVEEDYISRWKLIPLTLFEYLKYVRRIIIVNSNNKRRTNA